MEEKLKTLNHFFDNIYCINLSHRIDRWEKVNNEFIKHNLIVEKFNAIDGKKIFTPGLNINAGNYGLVLTQIKIFEDAIEKKYNKILIFEDDVFFIDNMNEKFWNKIAALPNDWNLLYLGGNNLFNKGNFEMVTGNKSIIINENNYITFDYELAKTKWTQCAHAIGFNSNIFQDLLLRLKSWDKPGDILFPLLANNNTYNAYVFLPSLAKQSPGFSDIENNYVNHNDNNINHF